MVQFLKNWPTVKQ